MHRRPSPIVPALHVGLGYRDASARSFGCFRVQSWRIYMLSIDRMRCGTLLEVPTYAPSRHHRITAPISDGFQSVARCGGDVCAVPAGVRRAFAVPLRARACLRYRARPPHVESQAGSVSIAVEWPPMHSTPAERYDRPGPARPGSQRDASETHEPPVLPT